MNQELNETKAKDLINQLDKLAEKRARMHSWRQAEVQVEEQVAETLYNFFQKASD